MKSILDFIIVLFCGIALTLACPLRASASTFYQGKTIVIAQGGGNPGGTADARTRSVVPYLRKHIPGSPNIVLQYMTAAGGIMHANYMSKRVKRDGLTIGVFPSSVFGHSVLGTPGVQYDLNDFIFLGSPIGGGGPYTLVIRPELGLDTVEKLKSHKGLRFAARSVGHTMYILGRVMAFVLELREPRWIVGYQSAELVPALERGEADARPNSIPSVLRQTPHWLKEGFGFPIVMKDAKGRGAAQVPEFPQGLPVLDQYADTELKRAIINLRNDIRPAGNVFMVPKGTPPEALNTLHEAFRRIWADPQFAKDFKKLTKEPANPTTGKTIEQAVRRMPKDPKLISIYKQIAGPGPLPPSR